MSDVRRLLDDGGTPLEKTLLEAAKSYKSSRTSRAKTLAALGLAESAAGLAGAGAAAAATSGSVAKLTGAKLLLAVTAVGVVTGVPIAYRVLTHGPRPATPVARPVARPLAQPRPVSEDVPRAVAVPREAEGPPRPARAPTRAVAARPSVPRVADPKAHLGVTLAQEVVALDAARAELGRGNGEGALFLLEGYSKTCPHGRLELEADLLRMEALVQTGQSRQARARAEAFLRRHPGSVLSGRARTYLER